MTMIFLTYTDGSTATLPDPGNWNPVNKVECLGAGHKGGLGTTGNPGNGGSTGCYAWMNNIVVTFPVSYTVGTPVAGIGRGVNFNTIEVGNFYSTYLPPANVVAAPCPLGGTGASGGLFGGGGGSGQGTPYPQGYNGSDIGGTSGSYGGGGGGAPGPHGAGTAGGNSSGSAGGNGSAADAGNTTGVTGNGIAGNNGTQWDATHGCGSGGSGSGSVSVPGGNAGQYGGGGGGGWGLNTNTGRQGGAGGNGLIVLTYVPYYPPKQIALVLS